MPNHEHTHALRERFERTPGDDEAFVALWDLSVAEEQWHDAADILGRRIGAIQEAPERVEALLRLGALLDERLGDFRGAIEAYKKALAIDPENQRALWALGVLYHDREDWQRVVEVCLRRMKLAKSADERLEIYDQLASIYEQGLEMPAQALMETIRAVRLAPQNIERLQNLEKLARRTESFEELRAVYLDVVERIERVDVQVALHLKLAGLHERDCDESQASDHYKRALALAEDRLDRLLAVGQIFGEEGATEELIALYSQLIRHTRAPSLKSGLHQEVVRLYRDGLGDAAQAFYELVRLSRSEPVTPGLIDEICALGVEADRSVALAAVLEDIGLHLVDDTTRASLYCRLARLHLEQLEDIEQARSAIHRALQADASNLEVQLAYFAILETDGEWEMLAQALELFLSKPDLDPGLARDQRHRLDLLCEEKLGDRAAEVRERSECLQAEEVSQVDSMLRPDPEPEFGEEPTEPGGSAAHLRELDLLLEEGATIVTLVPLPGKLEDADAQLAALLEQSSEDTLEETPSEDALRLKPVASALSLEADTESLEPVESAEGLEAGSEDLALADSVQGLDSGAEDLEPVASALSLEADTESLEPVESAEGLEAGSEDLASAESVPGLDSEAGDLEPVASALSLESVEPVPGLFLGEFDEDMSVCESAESIGEEPTLRVEAIDALDALWRVVRADPYDPNGWERLASMVLKRKGAEAAFDVLAEGIRAMPRPQEQLRLCRRLASISQQSPLSLRLGALLESEGLIEEAESTYRAILRSEPAHLGALDGLFRIYQERTALDRFDALLTRTLGCAAESEDRKVLLFRRAALRHHQLCRADDALLDVETLLSIEPGHPAAVALKEEILESLNRHEALIEAYQSRLQQDLRTDERVDLLTAIGILFENLKNDDEARRHYRLALAADPSHVPALESLLMLLEKHRDWLGAIEQIQTSHASVGNPVLVAALHHRAGKILEEQLLRPEEAEEAYRQAAQIVPPNRDALLALRRLARCRGDWVQVIELTRQLVPLTADPSERADLWIELARIFRDRLENPAEAEAAYAEAQALDPCNLEAAKAVALAHTREQRHAEAQTVLAHLTGDEALARLEPEDAVHVFLRMAQSAEALGQPEQAYLAFRKALEHSPRHPLVFKQLAAFLMRAERFAEAVQVFEELLRICGSKLSPDEGANLCCLLAQAHLKLDNTDQAAAQYRSALDQNPKHLPALRALAELARKKGDRRTAIDLLTELRALSSAPTLRLQLSIQIGDLWAEGLCDPEQAAQAYSEALEVESNNLELLEKLRRVLVHAGHFEKATEVLERLAQQVPTGHERARYLRIAGDLLRERLCDDAQALDLYLRSLDDDPLDLRTHAAAVKILTDCRAWSRLARLDEELLRRLPPPIPGREDRRISILQELFELYCGPLADRTQAIAIGEELLELDPSLLKVREELAKQYEAEGDLERALELHRSLIASSPFSIDSYHALRRIYESRGQTDSALCVAATLAFLDEATDEERAIHRRNRNALSIPAGRRLSEFQYHKLLLHPDAAGILGEMISFAADYGRPLFVVPAREYRLRPRDQLSLDQSDDRLVSAIQAGLDFLGLPAPEVYLKEGQVKGIMPVNTSPVALLCSEEAVRRASSAELRFMVTRALAFTRAENLLSSTLSAKELRTLLEAMVELVLPGGVIQSIAEEVGALARKLSRLIPETKLDRLRELAKHYREVAEHLSILEWLEGVEHTCNRAGLLAAGDLEAAVQVLKAARVVSPTGSHRALIRELIFYSISEEHFALRAALCASV